MRFLSQQLNSEGPIMKKLNNIEITRENVLKEINRLKSNKSPGPDNIYARVLKECKEELSEPLLTLYRSSLETGTVPKSWRTANVVPILKKETNH